LDKTSLPTDLAGKPNRLLEEAEGLLVISFLLNATESLDVKKRSRKELAGDKEIHLPEQTSRSARFKVGRQTAPEVLWLRWQALRPLASFPMTTTLGTVSLLLSAKLFVLTQLSKALDIPTMLMQVAHFMLALRG